MEQPPTIPITVGAVEIRLTDMSAVVKSDALQWFDDSFGVVVNRILGFDYHLHTFSRYGNSQKTTI